MISCFNETTPVCTLLTRWWITSILKGSKWWTNRRHLQTLNHIKNLWNTCKTQCMLGQLPPQHCKNRRQTSREKWDRIPAEHVDNLILSMPSRCRECRARRGGHTLTILMWNSSWNSSLLNGTAINLLLSILFSVFRQFEHYWLCAIFGDSVVFLCWNGRQFLVTTVVFLSIVRTLKVTEQ